MVLSNDALDSGLDMDLGFGFLVLVNFLEKYFNNVGLIFVSMVFGSVVGPCLFVVYLSGGEVCLEVWPVLVSGRFVIPLFTASAKMPVFVMIILPILIS